jgi:hypothetical protein
MLFRWPIRAAKRALLRCARTKVRASAAVAKPAPLSAVLASLPSYPQPVIESVVEKMIARLDGDDGD